MSELAASPRHVIDRWNRKMASIFKPSNVSLSSGVDITELDRALHNLEFEKKQQIQGLEKERQQIGVLEQSLKEKQDGIKRMEEELCRIDEETKNCHRQFRQNKEQKESQKAHASALNFHLEAKEKEFQQLVEKYEVENASLQGRLEHYEMVWKSYEDIYMQQENAQQLMKWQLEVLQRKEAVKEGGMQIARLQKAEEDLQQEIAANEPPFPSIIDFIIRIAETKVSTEDKKREIEHILDFISVAEKEIQVLKETQAEILKTLEEEKKKEEEQERQRKEKEKQEKEKKEKAKQEEFARKKKEEQQHAANSKAGVHKFGQFLHHAPSQTSGNQMPANAKRSAPAKTPQVSARTPFLQIPSPASNARQPSRYSAPQGSSLGGGGAQGGSTQPPVSQPSNRFLINVPIRSPAPVDRANRRPPSLPYMGIRGASTQQPGQSSQSEMVPSSPSVALADTMFSMNLQTPTRTTKTLPQVSPATHRQFTLEVRREDNGEPSVGPGGDAQPSPTVSKDQQQPGPEDGDVICRPLQPEESDFQEGADADSIQEFPLTPKSGMDVGSDDGRKTPHTPTDHFDLASFKNLGKPSPGFSYSCRAMFGDQGDDTKEDQSSNQNNSNFQENPFFSSFFGETSRYSDQQPSTPALAQEGGAMSMFGNSPSPSQSSQPQQEQESMGFSFNFDGASPSQTPGGESNGGGSRPGGFCLF